MRGAVAKNIVLSIVKIMIKGFLTGFTSGAIFVGSFLYYEYLGYIPPIVASIFLAIAGWFFKESYDSYNKEIKSLRRVEAILVKNLAKNRHNREFFIEWRGALKDDRLYAVVFRDYVPISNYDPIRENKLFNTLLKLEVSFEALGLDIKNFYESYSEGSKEMLLTEHDHVREWKEMNKNILLQTEEFKNNFDEADRDTVKTIAELRSYHKRLSFTIFRMVRILGLIIFPFDSKKAVNEELKRIEVERNTKNGN